MNLEEGEEFLLKRMEDYIKYIDEKMQKSLNKRRSLIMHFFIYILSDDDKKNIINPIWDTEFYDAFIGIKNTVKYITPQVALFLTHRAILNAYYKTEVIPYEEEFMLSKFDTNLFYELLPYGFGYVLDMAVLRQLRKGLIWKTLNNENSMRFETNYDSFKFNDREMPFYKSAVIIPETLEKSIELYELRKAKNMTSLWSIDISSGDFENLISLYLTQKDIIQEYYRCSLLSLFSFIYALMDLSKSILRYEFFKDYIGIVYSKEAFIDALTNKIIDDDMTRFEKGLFIVSKFLNSNENLVTFNIIFSRIICEVILDKYIITYKNLSELNDFINIPNLLYEIEPNCILFLSGFFSKISATILEKPLIKKGEWLEYKGKEFEKYCRQYIKKNLKLKTFSYKIKDEFKNDVGNIDIGVFKKPYIFICECKNYALNTHLLNGDFRAVIERIIDKENGYLGWLSQIDDLCKKINYEELKRLFSKNGEDITEYKYIVPLVLVWRPEFILDINTNLLYEEIPRVCTFYELEKVLSVDINPQEYMIPIIE